MTFNKDRQSVETVAAEYREMADEAEQGHSARHLDGGAEPSRGDRHDHPHAGAKDDGGTSQQMAKVD
jgi:hypothetical protein